ncbi:MAG TPA: HmuY family protein [Gemmatimonadales bacterium]|nr:HmuY family protein [Gemmatimonadales bacterium]
MSARPPIMLFVLAGAFLLLVAALLIGSFAKPDYPPFALSVPRPLPAGDSLAGPATYTLDASSTDRWRYFSFGEGSEVSTPASWDVAFRRFHLIAGDGGGIEDLGEVPFDSVRQAPDSGYLANVAADDTTNPGVGKWYDYSMISHLLTSRHHVYAIRTAGGKYAKLELLAYYCKEVGTACITFRYAYQGNGSRLLRR